MARSSQALDRQGRHPRFRSSSRLEWLEGEVTSRDVGMVFMAGHGVTDNRQRFYYFPVRRRSGQTSLNCRVARRNAKHDEQSRRQGLDVYRCLPSAASLEGEQTRGSTADITAVVNELSSVENGVVMFASSTGSQVSIERDDWKNGALPKLCLKALRVPPTIQGRQTDDRRTRSVALRASQGTDRQAPSASGAQARHRSRTSP